ACLGVADAITNGRRAEIYIETSTIGIDGIGAIAARLQGSGIDVLDSPVSGGPAGALAGTLAIIVACPSSVLERARPVLAGISESIIHVGDRPGLAQMCKLVNNAISITTAAVSYEAVVAGVKAGIDPEVLLEVVNAGTGRNS